MSDFEKKINEYQEYSYTIEGKRSLKRQRIRDLQYRRNKNKRFNNNNKLTPRNKNLQPKSSYLRNSMKEDLCLEYIKIFRKNFDALYGDKELKEPYIVAKNEYGIDKIICLTLRPTLLPYSELYNIDTCSNFVSNFLNYEPLENPTRTPEYLPSPNQVLKWLAGDSFDFSNILTSFLLGAGYDAYVVVGTAPKWICLKDQSQIRCPLIQDNNEEQEDNNDNNNNNNNNNKDNKENKNNDNEKKDDQNDLNDDDIDNNNNKNNDDEKGPETDENKNDIDENSKDNNNDNDTIKSNMNDNKTENSQTNELNDNNNNNENEFDNFIPKKRYQLEKRGVKLSEWIEMEEAKKNQKKDIDFDIWREIEGIIKIDEEELPEKALERIENEDPLYKQRVHSWVLVRAGKRGVEKMVFIEPSTGKIYPVESSPYYSIQSVYNSKNLWVNVQSKELNISQLMFDLNNEENWEFVFMTLDQQSLLNAQDGIDNLESIDFTGNNSIHSIENNNILNLPPPWSDKLYIHRELFANKYPTSGKRTIFYYKSKVELFAPGMNEEGIIQRITIYRDQNRLIIEECQDIFENRADKLYKRIRYPLENKIHEWFLPGRITALKEWIEWTGKRRIFKYYIEAQLNGMYKREEEIGKYIVEYFQNRPDNLIERSITIMSDNLKNTKKFKTPYSFPSNITGRELYISKMSEKYKQDHSIPADESIAKRTYYCNEERIRTLYHYAKGNITRRLKVHYKDRHNVITTLNQEENETEEQEDLHIVLNAERECYGKAKFSFAETQQLIKVRKREEQEVIIEKTLYERARERSKKEILTEQKNEQLDFTDIRRDYLSPYLQDVNDPNNLTKEEAIKVKDNCIKALKDRLLERANIIQTRLNEENAALAKKQAAFQRSQRDVDPAMESEFEHFCSDAMFRIQILEQRLVSHESAALTKLQELESKLSSDQRLAILKG